MLVWASWARSSSSSNRFLGRFWTALEADIEVEIRISEAGDDGVVVLLWAAAAGLGKTWERSLFRRVVVSFRNLSSSGLSD